MVIWGKAPFSKGLPVTQMRDPGQLIPKFESEFMNLQNRFPPEGSPR